MAKKTKAAQGTKKAAATRTSKGKPPKVSAKKMPVKKTAAKQASKSTESPAPVESAPESVPVVERSPGFPIVGIGASAGGLEALEAFFRAMPPDAGIGFVLVVHLDPKHVSILPEILQKYTTMPVCQAKDGVRVEPNHVYVIPPNQELAILHGTLQLMELSRPRGANLPIDLFFRALAQDQQQNAVCIVLSGTGCDGTLGVQAIKGEMGMVMVQDEESAKYAGMPHSAISTGLADYVLPPAKMPSQLIQYTSHAMHKGTARLMDGEAMVPGALQKIFVILRSRTGHDFSLYKKNTLCRRIERRMNVHQIDDISDYVRYVQQSEHEADILFKELLIGVTNFFRDPEAFEVLKTDVLPKLLADKPDGYTVRVWVIGCASGEEAYSVAIVLHECLESIQRQFHAQVFATDIDKDAVDVARAGLYPESILDDVGHERIRRYFTKEDEGHYRVKKSIREMLVFASQDVIKDPPFTKLDLICCRNLLIYLRLELQQKLLPLFHYGLKRDGILFLGSSETIGRMTDLFSVANRKWRLFRRKPLGPAARLAIDFPPVQAASELRDSEIPEIVREVEELSSLQLVETVLRQTKTPPCAIINNRCDVVYVHGRVGQFLEPAEGKVSVNVVEMARPELKAELAAALRRVADEKQEIVVKDLQVQDRGGTFSVKMTVKPVPEQSAMRDLMVVMFEETAAPAKPKVPKAGQAAAQRHAKSVEQLQQDLQYTKESLQTMIEELETSNEELKSTNEELQSANEELQSTNEELETSKEELQSLNEEAVTVNAELQSRNEELARTTDDIRNLLDATEVATVFLDVDLRVRRFTPRATDLVPLTASDVGRPIDHLASKLIGVDFAEHGRQVLEDLALREQEVTCRDGRHYIMRVRPYRTTTNVIDGVVMTFQDITTIKRAEEAERLAIVVRDSNDAITLMDRAGQIVAWNRGAECMYGYTEAEALEMNVTDIVPESRKDEELRLVEKVFRGELVRSCETQRLTKDGRTLDIWLTVTLLSGTEGNPALIATTERNVTEYLKGRMPGW
ncbi:MAG: PAS domain-containing protein [Pirellulales bacterium]|nr:PAS domain-containing protein [Pirellulales bacterium]